MGETTTDATLGDVVSLLRELVAAARTPPLLLERDELADLLRIGPTKLDTLRATGEIGPREIKLGRSVLWRREEILSWLANPAPNGDLMDVKSWAVWRREDERRKSR